LRFVKGTEYRLQLVRDGIRYQLYLPEKLASNPQENIYGYRWASASEAEKAVKAGYKLDTKTQLKDVIKNLPVQVDVPNDAGASQLVKK